MTENPFGALATRPAASTAVAQSDQQRAIAEVQAAMMIARTNPRDPIAAVDRILNACARPTLANAALYSYARGGQDITGPSIRLAEAMAQQWGNIKTSVRELDHNGGSSTVQAIAWDLETGYQCDKVFHVPHERHTKQGVKKLTDPRDIYELVANQGARRLRACILAVIPGDVTEAAVEQCNMTMHAKADTSHEGVGKMVAAFEVFGVTKAQIEKRIQRRLDAIKPAQIVSLKKIYASLRDSMSAPGDWFDADHDDATAAPSSRTEALKDRVRAKKPAAPAPSADTGDDELRDLEQQNGAPSIPFAEVATALQKAANDDQLAEAADLIQHVHSDIQRDELGAIYNARAAAIRGE